MLCPKCNEIIPSSSRVCMHCGHIMSLPETTPEVVEVHVEPEKPPPPPQPKQTFLGRIFGKKTA